MKRFYLLSFICAGIILLSLFLPYNSTYYNDGIPRASGFDPSREITNGWFYLPFSIIPVVIIGCITGLNAIRENVGTAITGLVVSIMNLIYMGGLHFIVSFNFMRHSETEIGFYIALLMVVAHIALMIIHLIQVIRNRKKPKKNPIISDDLLDREF